jgi:opacity protein-like surface antigen
MNLKRTIAAGALVLMSAVGAIAADIPAPIAVTPPPPPPPAPMAPAFDWSGPYVGAYGGYVFGGVWIQAGVQAGYNMVRGNFLAGLEAQAGAAFLGGTVAFEGNLNARLGFVLGSRFLLYGEAGLGIVIPAPVYLWSAGGGLEIGLGTSASLFAEAKVVGAFGGGIGYSVQGGLNWHPGN